MNIWNCFVVGLHPRRSNLYSSAQHVFIDLLVLLLLSSYMGYLYLDASAALN